jgi:predicted RNA-binding Zn ribbon-like protein
VRAADVELVNRWAERPPLAPRLAADGNSTEPATRCPVETCLATIARDAVELLTSPLARRVRECAADDCALLFVDVSRGGRRRWCSMQACGNRAKARGFRERTRGAEAAA